MDPLTAMERLHARRPELRLEHPIAERRLAAGDLAGARAMCQEGLATKPGYYQLYLTLGKVAELEGRLSDAVDAFEHALGRSPDNRLAAFRLATLFARTGRSADIPPLLRRFPDLGDDLVQRGDESPAVGAVPPPQRPPADGEILPSAFVNPTVAELYWSQGHPEKAEAIYEELRRLRPHDAAIAARLAAIRSGATPPQVEAR
ncbi:MAG: tetratricopeptide repeat protein [Nitrospirota bacterium]|jgi:tetratricopeptide (TPR) repeat protein